MGSVLLFSKLNKIFFGYFDPQNILLDNENKKIRGDLTGFSAKKEALHGIGRSTLHQCFCLADISIMLP